MFAQALLVKSDEQILDVSKSEPAREVIDGKDNMVHDKSGGLASALFSNSGSGNKET